MTDARGGVALSSVLPNTTEQLVREHAYPAGSHAVSSEEWREGTKCGWVACRADTLYERESTPIKLVWGAEEAMLGSLNYIPPVLCHVHTMALA